MLFFIGGLVTISCSIEKDDVTPPSRDLIPGYYLYTNYDVSTDYFWAEGYEINEFPIEDVALTAIGYELGEYYYEDYPVAMSQVEDTVYLIVETYEELGNTFTEEYPAHYNPADTSLFVTVKGDFGEDVIEVMKYYSDPTEFPNN